jgi:hypothetical protein
VDNGANEAAFAAYFILCDRAQFKIINSTFRWNVQYSFQYWIWAAGSSRITYRDAKVVTLAKSITDANPNGKQILLVTLTVSLFAVTAPVLILLFSARYSTRSLGTSLAPLERDPHRRTGNARRCSHWALSSTLAL